MIRDLLNAAADGLPVDAALAVAGPDPLLDADNNGLTRIVDRRDPTQTTAVAWIYLYGNADEVRDNLTVHLTDAGRDYLAGA